MGDSNLKKELDELLELAKHNPPSPADVERQRRSFAYGNTRFENDRITRDTVEEAAADLGKPRGSED